MSFRFPVLLLLTVLLLACGGDQDVPERAPVWQSLDNALAAYQRSDASAVLEALAPPLMRDRWAQRWDVRRQQPVTDAFRERFAQRLDTLTADGAQQELVSWLSTRAGELDDQKAQLLPSLRAILLTAANVDADQAGRQAELRLLDSLLSWVQRTQLSDPRRLEQASGLIVEQLRKSPIRRWSDVEAMDFVALVDEADRLLRIVRGVLEIYQLAPADVAAGVTFDTLQTGDRRAMVRMQLRLFAQPHRMDLPMVQRETGWYLEAIARQAPPEPPPLRAAQPRD